MIFENKNEKKLQLKVLMHAVLVDGDPCYKKERENWKIIFMVKYFEEKELISIFG